jgi:hypothetical protein
MTFQEYFLQARDTEQEVANFVERRVSDFLSKSREDGDFHDAPWLNLDTLANSD